MERDQCLATGSRKLSSRSAIGGYLAGALILSLGLNAAAFGASNMGDECDHKSFMRPAADTDELALSVVDLTNTKDEAAISAPPESVSDEASPAPLLFLTPRVESIVDDVFAEGVNQLTEDSEADAPSGMTPLADSIDEPVTAPAADPIDDTQPLDLRHLLPSIQRQMYRTDI